LNIFLIIINFIIVYNLTIINGSIIIQLLTFLSDFIIFDLISIILNMFNFRINSILIHLYFHDSDWFFIKINESEILRVLLIQLDIEIIQCSFLNDIFLMKIMLINLTILDDDFAVIEVILIMFVVIFEWIKMREIKNLCIHDLIDILISPSVYFLYGLLIVIVIFISEYLVMYFLVSPVLLLLILIMNILNNILLEPDHKPTLINLIQNSMIGLNIDSVLIVILIEYLLAYKVTRMNIR
jgi:hypothetical protein